jgi:hypothetical protein
MLRNINELITQINSLQIYQEDYDYYVKLLDLPKPVFIQVMIGIIDGKISARDFIPILEVHRAMIYQDEGVPSTISIRDQIMSKFNGETPTDVPLKRDPSSEQLYITNMAANADIPLNPDEWQKIFISNEDYEVITLNYEEVQLSVEDTIFMAQNNIGELNMKKMKLLRNYLLLTKPYNGGDK